MIELIRFIDWLIGFYIWWVLFPSAILSWLLAFGVLDSRNRFVYTIADILYRLTEPLLRPIRRIVPSFGGIDISFIILFIGLMFIRSVILPNLARTLYF